ncbi:hypothetical protein [Streptomyces pini]|uniref:Phage protein Gp19/Gp15/Gp42 n=1 Tax=Streptomyces pini TaxID=1520580 RepID=A0A1I4BX94_9ACTN|nr:hypothetical protein [Streptomyces pini]SFK73143.1 hypothetical protein SAMN05192584_108168 [Streptomyces pini]
MAAYATVDDYEARAAVTLTGAKRAQVEAYLADASALMRRHIPAGHEPDPDVLRTVAVAVTRRVMANPGGYRQRTIGQYSETLGEDGGLYLTDDEVALLQPTPVEDPGSDAAYTIGLVDDGGWSPVSRGGWVW